MAMVQTAISREVYRHQLTLPLGQLLNDSKFGYFFNLIPHFKELNTDSLFHDNILCPHGVRSIRAPGIDIWYWEIGIPSHCERLDIIPARDNLVYPYHIPSRQPLRQLCILWGLHWGTESSQ